MKPKRFWKLEIYEWSLWLNRIVNLQEKRKQDHELLIELERNTMALMANIHRSKDAPIFTGTDFYKLSYDEIVQESDKILKVTGKELFELMNNRFKNKPIRRKNG
jgi:hypothetical protein